MEDTGRYRRLPRRWHRIFLIFTGAGILLAIYQLFSLSAYTDFLFMENTYLYLLLTVFLSLVFILLPAGKRSPRDRVPWYDVALFVITIGVTAYYAWLGPTMVLEGWEFHAPLMPTVLGTILWLLVLEAARRAAGLALLIVVLVFSLYPLYAGYMPSIVQGFNLGFRETASYHAMSALSIAGMPLRVIGTLFIGFLIMGAALVTMGGGQFFINLSLALLGRFRGGAAKVSIFASALFGTMSGSVVSNVIGTGTFTIPTMKRLGFAPRYAAAVEACASTGGVLMPPIMGAVAFVMASYLAIPYSQVVIAAVIPSILYYFGLFMQIDAYAARTGLRGLPQTEIPSLLKTLKEGWFYIFVLVALVWLLLLLKREAQAPFYASVMLLLLPSIRKETRLNVSRFLEFMAMVGRILVEMVAMLTAVGLIIGALSVTGMAVTFASDLVAIAGGNTYLLLVMGAIASFIMGMGMSAIICYLFLAITLAPALQAGGLNTIAVHLFILYWGMISFITPPVAVGAFTAAAIARSDPMRTGYEAMRLGAILYFLPFFFVLNPALVLQQATFGSFTLAFGTAAIATFLIAEGLQGYFIGIGPLRGGFAGWLTRIPLVIGGVLIGWPDTVARLIGLTLAALTVLGYLTTRLRAAQTRPVTDTLP